MMKSFRLNHNTLASIKASTGLDASTISSSDISVIDETIEKHTGKSLTPSLSLGGIHPRGSVYLMLDRLFTREYIDRQLNRIKT